MKTFKSHNLLFKDDEEQHLVYCGLDTLMTFSIFKAMEQKKNNTYEYSLSLLAPAMTMMRRGLDMDMEQVEKELPILEDRLAKLDQTLQRLAACVWGANLNYNTLVS